MERAKVLRAQYLRRRMARKNNLKHMLDVVGFEHVNKVIIEEEEILDICNIARANVDYMRRIAPVSFYEMRVGSAENFIFFLSPFVMFERSFYLMGRDLDEWPILRVRPPYSSLDMFRNIFDSGDLRYLFHVADIDLKYVFCVEYIEGDHVCPEYNINVETFFPGCSKDMAEYWKSR